MNNLVKAFVVATLVAGVVVGIFIFKKGGDDPSPVPGGTDTPVVASQADPVVSPIGEPLPDADLTTYDLPGKTIKEGGKGLAGVEVSAYPSGSTQASSRSTSDASGSFKLAGLKPGKYSIRGRLAGFQEVRTEFTIISGQSPVTLTLEFASGLAISGYVRNEVQQPVQGARVTAFQEHVRKNASLVERLMLLSKLDEIQSSPGVNATSDGEGWYQVVGLGRGEYRVQSVAGGFGPSVLRYVNAGSDDANFQMLQGGVLSGVVMSPEGPVAEAEISVYRSASQSNPQELDVVEEVIRRTRPPLAKRITDETGEYEFDELGGQGEYRLVVAAPGYQNKEIPQVVVDIGQPLELDIVLEAGLVIRGVVYDPNGAVLPGAIVKSNFQSGKPSAQLKLTDDGEPTDENGGFLFDTLEDGDYRIVVSHELYASFAKNRVTPSEDTELEIHLTQGGAVEGRISDSVSGEPVAGATVRIRDIAGVEKVATSNKNGVYQVRGLTQLPKNRPSAISIEAEGYARRANAEVQVFDGQLNPGQDFMLDKNGFVAGKVVDAEGQPVAGCRVTVKRQHSPEVPVIINVSGTVKTNANGVFRISDVAPGDDCFLAGNHADFLECESERFSIGAHGKSEDLELVMREGGSIEGVVLDDAGAPLPGALVALQGDSLMTLPAGSQEIKTTAGEDGKFLLTQLKAGTHTLIAAANGFLETEVTGVDVVEGRRTPGIQIQLTKGSFVAGTVVDGRGNVLHGASIKIIDTFGGVETFDTKTDVTGYFRWEKLGPYDVRVDASMKGYGTVMRHDVPVNNENVNFTLYRLGSVQGVVSSVDGSPVVSFSVHPKVVVNGREVQKYRSKTFNQSADGTYHYQELEAGTYNVVVGSPGFAPYTHENVVVNPSSVTELPPTILDEGGKLSGYVISSASGEPVVGATVQVQGLGRAAFVGSLGQPGSKGGRGRAKNGRSVTDRNGFFQIIGLGPTITQVTIKVEQRGHVSLVIPQVDVNTHDLEIVMDAGGIIRGQITGPDGGFLSGRQVLLAGEGLSKDSVSDRKGQYRFTGLPSGTYTLVVTQFGRVGSGRKSEAIRDAPKFTVTVRAGETVDFPISLPE